MSNGAYAACIDDVKCHHESGTLVVDDKIYKTTSTDGGDNPAIIIDGNGTVLTMHNSTIDGSDSDGNIAPLPQHFAVNIVNGGTLAADNMQFKNTNSAVYLDGGTLNWFNSAETDIALTGYGLYATNGSKVAMGQRDDPYKPMHFYSNGSIGTLMYANNGSQINFSNGSLFSDGGKGPVIAATGNSTIRVDDATIARYNYSNQPGTTISVEDKSFLALNRVNITSNGDHQTALDITKEGRVRMTAGDPNDPGGATIKYNVVNNGDYSTGIRIADYNSKVYLDPLIIDYWPKHQMSQLDMNGYNIHSNGWGATGLYIGYAVWAEIDGKIKGDNANSQIILNNFNPNSAKPDNIPETAAVKIDSTNASSFRYVDIITNGDNAHGILLTPALAWRGAKNALVGVGTAYLGYSAGNITTNGNNAHGMSLSAWKVVTLRSVDINTRGENSSGLNLFSTYGAYQAYNGGYFYGDKVNINSEKSFAITSNNQGAELHFYDSNLSGGDGLLKINGTDNDWKDTGGGYVSILTKGTELIGGVYKPREATASIWIGDGSSWTITASKSMGNASHISSYTSRASHLQFSQPEDPTSISDYKTLHIGETIRKDAPWLSGSGPILIRSAPYIPGYNNEITINTYLNKGGDLSNQLTDRILVNGGVEGQFLININQMEGSPGGETGNTNEDGTSIIQILFDAKPDSFILKNGPITMNGLPFIYDLYAFGPGSSLGAASQTQKLVGANEPLLGDDYFAVDNDKGHWDYRLQSVCMEPCPPPTQANPEGDTPPPRARVADLRWIPRCQTTYWPLA